MRAGIVFDVNPTFKTVSIIPGIDVLAPDRTETNRGFSSFPNFAPIAFSVCFMAFKISVFNPGGKSQSFS